MQEIEALVSVIDTLKEAIRDSKNSETTDRRIIHQLNELDCSATLARLRLERLLSKHLDNVTELNTQ